ncbi:hypothetical protein FOVSG1_001341 [Fusarium oxysporum f. sp. vasinfectum]
MTRVLQFLPIVMHFGTGQASFPFTHPWQAGLASTPRRQWTLFLAFATHTYNIRIIHCGRLGQSASKTPSYPATRSTTALEWVHAMLDTPALGDLDPLASAIAGEPIRSAVPPGN